MSTAGDTNMERTRWLWFASGLLLGILFGGSVVSIVSDVRVQEEREMLLRDAEEAAMAAQEHCQQVEEQRDRALKELEALKKAKKDR